MALQKAQNLARALPFGRLPYAVYSWRLCLARPRLDWNDLKTPIRRNLNDFAAPDMRRRPIGTGGGQEGAGCLA